MKPAAPWKEPVIPYDLGNLAGVKIGDEVTTLDENGKPGSRVYFVHKIEDWRVIVKRERDGRTFGAWQIKNKGGCPYAMHDQNVMRYYYSANPAHIAQAKANAEAERVAELERKAAREALMTLARPVGEVLGDCWDDGGDYPGYQRESAANALADKLTPEQIKTLADWLGVKVGDQP